MYISLSRSERGRREPGVPAEPSASGNHQFSEPELRNEDQATCDLEGGRTGSRYRARPCQHERLLDPPASRRSSCRVGGAAPAPGVAMHGGCAGALGGRLPMGAAAGLCLDLARPRGPSALCSIERPRTDHERVPRRRPALHVRLDGRAFRPLSHLAAGPRPIAGKSRRSTPSWGEPGERTAMTEGHRLQLCAGGPPRLAGQLPIPARA